MGPGCYGVLRDNLRFFGSVTGRAGARPRTSRDRPAASVVMLHGGTGAWCLVIMALEPHSFVLRMYDRGEATELTVRPADLEALQLGALSGDGGTALYL